VPRFIAKAETELSPCVVTKRAPLTDGDDVLVLEQLIKPIMAMHNQPASNTNFISIVLPVFISLCFVDCR
jgi:hypothetical protein